MLTEGQCKKLEWALTEQVEPRKVAAYLCLHMGLTVAEASALRVSDLSSSCAELCIRMALTRVSPSSGSKSRFKVAETESARTLPVPAHVRRYLIEHKDLYESTACFLISGETETPGGHLMQNLLVSINTRYRVASTLTAVMLRNTFIRRCFESGIDLYTIGEYLGVKHLSELQKRFAAYVKPNYDAFERLERYGRGYELPLIPRDPEGKRMNLLILGTGALAKRAKTIALRMGIFERISFLSDDPNEPSALDGCDRFARYAETYPIAIPAFDDVNRRAKWSKRLADAGFTVTALIHPFAIVSPEAQIGPGAMIDARAVVGAGAVIGRGCILSEGTIVEADAALEEFCVMNREAAAVPRARVEAFTELPAYSIAGRIA